MRALSRLRVWLGQPASAFDVVLIELAIIGFGTAICLCVCQRESKGALAMAGLASLNLLLLFWRERKAPAP